MGRSLQKKLALNIKIGIVMCVENLEQAIAQRKDTNQLTIRPKGNVAFVERSSFMRKIF